MSPQPVAPEFSVEVRLDTLPREGKTISLCASAAERAAIAKRLAIPAVEKLEGKVRLVATPKAIMAEGRVEATLTRICVASLEELSETIGDSFEVEFFRMAPDAGRIESDEAWNAPEVHEGQSFDIGELIVQHVALAMAPFPRKPDALSLAEKYGPAAETSPFSAIAGEFEKSDKNQ